MGEINVASSGDEGVQPIDGSLLERDTTSLPFGGGRIPYEAQQPYPHQYQFTDAGRTAWNEATQSFGPGEYDVSRSQLIAAAEKAGFEVVQASSQEIGETGVRFRENKILIPNELPAERVGCIHMTYLLIPDQDECYCCPHFGLTFFSGPSCGSGTYMPSNLHLVFHEMFGNPADQAPVGGFKLGTEGYEVYSHADDPGQRLSRGPIDIYVRDLATVS